MSTYRVIATVTFADTPENGTAAGHTEDVSWGTIATEIEAIAAVAQILSENDSRGESEVDCIRIERNRLSKGR